MGRIIRVGDQGDEVRVLQRNLNARLKAHGDKPVPVNGKCGPKLMERAAFAAWFLGAGLDTVRKVQAGAIPVGVQQMLANPDRRDAAQRRRARDRRGKRFPALVTRRVLVQAGHIAPREPGFESQTGTDGEQQLVRAIRDKLVVLLNRDGRFEGIPVPGDIPDGIKVDAALFLHADGVDNTTARGFQFGFPSSQNNKKLVGNIRKEFLKLANHPPSRQDNSTKDASGYYGFRRVQSPYKVLVEHGFLTNPTERTWLKANTANLARAEYQAICRTFDLEPIA